MSHILLAARDDSAAFCDRIQSLVEPEGVTIHNDLATFPDPAAIAVVLVVLSPQALADPAVAAFIAEARRRRLPIVPVVEDLEAYDSSTLPIAELTRLNGVGWQPGDGREILRAVRVHLGHEALPRKKKAFLSYRRQDGGEIAQRIYNYLRRHDYEPFLDKIKIEAGADFQQRLFEELADKDFVLLIDTPMARKSTWVQAEIVEALNQRIPVRVLAVGQPDPHPLIPDVERLTWNVGSRMLARVLELVSRGIASSSTFDVRCRRVLEDVAELRGLGLADHGRRRVILSSGRRQASVEYERAPPSLERLHRLYRSYDARRRGPAVLISGDQSIPEPTADAIVWARGRAPLEVVPLHDVASLLDVLFA